jgi:hypothetical protein
MIVFIKGGKLMYNNVEELKIFLVDMAHDIETDDEELAEDLRKLAETL